MCYMKVEGYVPCQQISGRADMTVLHYRHRTEQMHDMEGVPSVAGLEGEGEREREGGRGLEKVSHRGRK